MTTLNGGDGEPPQNGTTPLYKEKDDNELEEDAEEKASCATSVCGVVPRFVINITCLVVLGMIMTVYNVGVLRTLERRFGLQSSQTGLVMAMNDVSHTLVVVFVGYLGRKAHKPRVISLSVLFMAASALLMASPHFIFSPAEFDVSLNFTEEPEISHCANSNATTAFSEADKVEDECTSSKSLDAASAGFKTYIIFMAAQFLAGIGDSAMMVLGIPYIDENTTKTKVSMYVGIVTAFFAVGPIGGFMLAAVCLRIPENPWAPTSTDPADPAFIGAWWLGYGICAIGIILAAIPMWFFPRHVLPPKTVNKKDDQNQSTIATIKHEFKDFLPSLVKLLTNKAYVLMLVSFILAVYIINGVYVNMPRYIEIHFLQPAFVASIVTAFVSAFAGVVGGFLGGAIMSRMKLTAVGGVRLMLFSMIVGCLGIIISMSLGCPRLNVAGDWDESEQMLSVDTACNADCGCVTEKGTYRPVCGSDNLTYYSPCHAGCGQARNGTYADCSCTESGGTARLGICNEPCKLLIPYAVSLFITSLLSSVGRVPTTIVQLRIVGEEMRSFALGFQSFAVNLLGFIPGPVLFGAIVDSTCILWQKTCNKRGACLLYDVTRFRLLTHGVSLVFLFGASIFIVILYLVVRKMDFSKTESEKIEVKEVNIEAPSNEMKSLIQEGEAF